MRLPTSDRRLEHLIADHRRAVEEFAARAKCIEAHRWLVPRAAGKWTPAQETRHIVLSYRLFERQLTDGTPIRLRGNALRRALWRLIGLNSILHLRRIPAAARAPREARPEDVVCTAAESLAELTQVAGAFEAAFVDSWRNDPRRRLTHHLFGALSLDQGMRLMCVHTRHHAAFLPTPSSAPLAPQPS